MKKILLLILIFTSFLSLSINAKDLNSSKGRFINHRRSFYNIDRFSYIGISYSNLGIYKLPSFGAQYVSRPFRDFDVRAMAGAIYSVDLGHAINYKSAVSVYLGGVFYEFFTFGVIAMEATTMTNHNDIRCGGLVGLQIPIFNNRIRFGAFTNSIERNMTATLSIAIR